MGSKRDGTNYWEWAVKCMEILSPRRFLSHSLLGDGRHGQGGISMGLHCSYMLSVGSDTGQSWLQHSGNADLCSGLI